MFNIWSIAIIGSVAAVVLAMMIHFFREQEYLARYEVQKAEVDKARAEVEAARAEMEAAKAAKKAAQAVE